MAPKRTKVNKLDYKNLCENDVICPICRSVLIRPITLPCSHGFCSLCFETFSSTQNANVVCPLCSVRVGSWLRTAAKSKKLVNEPYWQAIQQLFPMLVKNKLREVNKTCQGPQLRKQKAGNDFKKDVVLSRNVQEPQKTSNSFVVADKTQLGSSTQQNMTIDVKNKPVVNEKRPIFVNNFATKEYTCRILCQDASNKDLQKKIIKEPYSFLQRKNKRIQELKELEKTDERSNSIESECLYFKPIDYRRNPPSEGLPPIKVPTKKASVSPQIKIIAPSGQNKINLNYLQSAFARLYSPEIIEEKMEPETKISEQPSAPQKRKNQKINTKVKKKVKPNEKITQNQTKGKYTTNVDTYCDNDVSKANQLNLIIASNCFDEKKSKKLVNAEQLKKALQEQADFELATKLQETYNQFATYSTRSAVHKRMATTNKVKIEEFIKPYKVN